VTAKTRAESQSGLETSVNEGEKARASSRSGIKRVQHGEREARCAGEYMRVRVHETEDADPVLVKFDGDLEALFEAIQAKLGFRPHQVKVSGARIADVNDLEDNDIVLASRDAPANKRAAEGEANGSSNAVGSSDAITISIQTADGVTISFKVRPGTKLSKVFKAFNERQGVQPGHYRYHIDGKRAQETGDATAADWELEDGDQIDASVEQEGGSRP
jgi:hypothetical protein